MRKERKFSLIEKVITAAFAALLVAAACAGVWRVVQKPAYAAREQLQCDLFAVSALEALSQMTQARPQMWVQLDDEVSLLIDHRRMPGSWGVFFEARSGTGQVHVTARAVSGWNSRIPKEALHSAVIDIPSGAIAYADETAEKLAQMIRAHEDTAGKELFFMFRDEKEPAVPIHVRLSEMRVINEEKPYLILRLAGQPLAAIG